MTTFSMIKMTFGIVQTLHFHTGFVIKVYTYSLVCVFLQVNVEKYFYSSSPQIQNDPPFSSLQMGNTRAWDFGSVPKMRNYSGNEALF